MLTRDQVEAYERTRGQFEALHVDFSNLAKKAADAPVNKLKIAIVNEKLRAANKLLKGPDRPLEGFCEFDEASLPTASDVVIVLSQYIDALEGWRSARVVYRDDWKWVWNTKERDYLSTSPSRFRKEDDE